MSAAGRRRSGGRAQRGPSGKPAPVLALREEVRILRLVPGGLGLGHLEDGRVVFVPGGLPGDTVLVTAVRLKKSFAEAVSYQLTAPSSERVPAVCAHAAECGGCRLMALAPESQKSQKLGLVADALSRVGKLKPEELPTIDWVSGAAFGYRQRVRMQIGGGRLGFFKEGSHDLVEVERCHVASPELWELVRVFRAVLAKAPSLFEGFSFAEVRRLEGEVRRLEGAALEGAAQQLEGTPTGSLFLMPERGAAISREQSAQIKQMLGDRLRVRVGGEATPLESMALSPGLHLKVPVGGFVQVNPEMNRVMVDWVIECAQSSGAQTFFDIFCGSGNFALPLLAAGLRGAGVEVSREAIAALSVALSEQGFGGDFSAGDATADVTTRAARGERYDLVLVDPPRAGAAGLGAGLARICANTLLMISCDPVTLARDLRQLVEQGFSVESVTALDMFPQTHHVETLVRLTAPGP